MSHHADYSNFQPTSDKSTILSQIVDSYNALVEGQRNWVCNLSNASSLLWHAYTNLNIPINWAGFYVIDPTKDEQLILGPFHGKVACQTIKFDKGVCGAAAKNEKTQLVKNVEEFPGHIACDGDTKSEIVVPIVDNEGILRGVIDIDCLELNGFSEEDQIYLEKLAKLVANSCDW